MRTVEPSPSPPAARRPRRLWPKVALAAVLAVALAGAALWWFVLRSDAPEEVSLDTAVAGIQATTTVPTAAVSGAPAATATTAAGRATDGRWTVDPSITNAQGTGSFAGFRINEVLATVGSTTAVGRTTSVEGTISVSGSTLTAAQIAVGLTDITTNDSRRDDAVQRALSTGQFPNATFVLTQPVDVGSVPAPGQRVNVSATGDLTIKGVTKPVTIEVQAQLEGEVLVVVGSAPVVLADHGVRAPTAPIVASVEDRGIFEFQLYFKKG